MKRPVVIRPVEAIAVYRNPKDDVVIRQQDILGGEDSFVIVPQDRLSELILALQNHLDDV